MRKLQRLLFVTLFSAFVIGDFVFTENVVAQNREGRRGGGRNLPKVGDELPDVTVFDEKGAPLKLRGIAEDGKYSVVVFGCLT